MGFILNDKLPVLMKGYPTTINTNGVIGGTLATDSEEGHFGDLVTYGGAKGFFKVASANNSITNASQVAGVILATNVKLDTKFGGGLASEVVTEKGEAFNLLVKGVIALELKTGTDLSTIIAGASVGVTADGKAELASAEGAVALPWIFTGITDTDEKGRLLAEVVVK